MDPLADEVMPRDELVRAAMLNDVGRHEQALRLLIPLMRDSPEDPDVLVEMGRARLGLGDDADVMQLGETLSRVSPEDEYGPFFRSLGLLAEGQYAEALAAAEQSVRLAPTSDMCHRLLAWTAMQVAGRRPHAMAAAREAVRLDPSNADNHTCLAGVALSYKDEPAAQAAVEEALQLEPSHPMALAHLAELRSRQGRYVEAVDHATSSAAAEPGSLTAPLAMTVVLRSWLTWLYRGVVGTLVLSRLAMTDRPGPAWPSIVVIAVACLTAASWGYNTVLQLSEPRRRQVLAVVRRSVSIRVWLWGVLASVAALLAGTLATTAFQRNASTAVAAAALFVATGAKWAGAFGAGNGESTDGR